ARAGSICRSLTYLPSRACHETEAAGIATSGCRDDDEQFGRPADPELDLYRYTSSLHTPGGTHETSGLYPCCDFRARIDGGCKRPNQTPRRKQEAPFPRNPGECLRWW